MLKWHHERADPTEMGVSPQPVWPCSADPGNDLTDREAGRVES